jgi:hypothetical protein
MNVEFSGSFLKDLRGVKDKALLRRVEGVDRDVRAGTNLK